MVDPVPLVDELAEPIIDTIGALVVVLDRRGRIVRFNAACEKTTGYSFEEVRGHTVWEFLLVPEEREAVREVFAALRDESLPNEHVNFWVTKGGEKRLIAWSNSTVHDEEGSVRYVVGTGIDITEQAAAETALEEREAELSAILNAAVDAIVTIAEDGTIRGLNRAAVQMFGYDAGEMVGRNVKMLMPEPDQRRHDDYLKRYKETGQRRIIGIGREVMARRKDGTTFPVHLSVSDVTLAGERIFSGILHDITDRKRTEALNTRLGRIVEASVNEVLVFDAESLRFVQANRAAARNLGYPVEELTALTPLDVLPDYDRESFAAEIRPLRNGALDRLVFDTRHRRRTGETYDVRVQLQYMPNETPPVFIAVVEDVTESKAREEQLRQAMKMEAIGQLTGGVAHDFNNLLTVITGNLEMLAARLDGDERLAALLGDAQEAADLGGELTGRLLAFARRQPLAPKVIDLNVQVLEMTELLRRTLGESIQISTVLANELQPAEVDPAQLQNALLNLAINARDAMPEGGSLTIETSNVELDRTYAEAHPGVEAGRYVELSVTDSGCGMQRGVQERAFEPFFTTKESGSGTGLGLSMVYGFAKQSKGHVRLYSEADRGTTVSLYLPPAQAARPPLMPCAALPEMPRARGEKVLVVEDDDRVRRVSVNRLEQLGYRVIEAADAATAMALVGAGEDFDLLFTDIVMPGGMSGPELAREVTAREPAMKVLFTTGFAEAAVFGEGGQLGRSAELLRKPYGLKDLAEKVRAALDA